VIRLWNFRPHEHGPGRFGHGPTQALQPVNEHITPLPVQFTNGFHFVSGFLYTLLEGSRPDRWDDQHRAWGGIERSLRAGSGALNVRAIYERHFGGPTGIDCCVT